MILSQIYTAWQDTAIMEMSIKRSICDRIVVGISDNKLSQKMQLEPDLTLEKAIDLACQCESIKKQQSIVRGQHTQQVAVEAIWKKHGRQ